jgi:predicted dehydrogenase
MFGEEKSILYDDSVAEGKIRIFGRGADTRRSHGATAPLEHSYGPDAITIPPLDEREPLYNEGSDFLECCTQGREPISSGHAGYLVVCVLEAAGQSMMRGGAPARIQVKP